MLWTLFDKEVIRFQDGFLLVKRLSQKCPGAVVKNLRHLSFALSRPASCLLIQRFSAIEIRLRVSYGSYHAYESNGRDFSSAISTWKC